MPATYVVIIFSIGFAFYHLQRLVLNNLRHEGVKNILMEGLCNPPNLPQVRGVNQVIRTKYENRSKEL